MANFFDKFKKTKTVTPIIFAVDASGSMTGERIQSVNKAIKSLVGKLDEANSLSDSLIEYSVLRFASGAQWLTDGFVTPNATDVPSIVAQGVTDLGCALAEINKKLSREGFFDTEKTYGLPLICFVTDGMPTDDYSGPLNELKENKWYKHATKFAVVIGDDVGCDVMNEVCGNIEAVVQLQSAALLEQILWGMFSMMTKTVSVTASRSNNDISISSDAWDDFDSDSVCCSRAADFDSDRIATSCCVIDDDFDSSSVAKTMSGWDDSMWDDGDWDTPQKSSDNAAERRRKLAEALRDGTAIVLDDIPNGENDDFLEDDSLPAIQVPPGKLAGGKFVPCSSCGESIGSWYKFCPNCGTPVKTEMPERVNVNQVQFSAVVPKQLIKGEYAMIDISVYEDTYRHIVDRIIANADAEVKEVVASSQDIVDNTMVRIILSSPDIDVFDCDETQKWQGRYLTYSFPVEIPSNYAKKQILFIASVYFNEIIATKLKFVVNCTSTREQKLQLTREDVLTAFISYASQDRSRVATIIQGMKKARPDMDIFFDVESLRSGEDWERALRNEIEKRDILFLCWSHFAKESKWVETEWRYALTNKGLDSIEPIPLVSPTECPPPDELKSKHFNDKALLYKEI